MSRKTGDNLWLPHLIFLMMTLSKGEGEKIELYYVGDNQFYNKFRMKFYRRRNSSTIQNALFVEILKLPSNNPPLTVFSRTYTPLYVVLCSCAFTLLRAQPLPGTYLVLIGKRHYFIFAQPKKLSLYCSHFMFHRPLFIILAILWWLLSDLRKSLHFRP